MSKKKVNTDSYDDGTYVVKENKKAGLVAFIVCLLIACLIWCYAKAEAMQEDANEPELPAVTSAAENGAE